MKKILLYCFSILITILVSSSFTGQSPKYKIGDKAYGGIIAWITEDGTHGLICSDSDLDKSNWEDAKKKCSELELGGKNDWYLPSEGELHILNENLHKEGFGNFAAEIEYWSSREYKTNDAFLFNFSYGYAYNKGKNIDHSVRAVRAF